SFCDCYVYSEVERVWQIVKGDLAGSFGTHGGANSAPVRRVLTGTSGIGKSVAAGAYLLYQLLHYDAEQLPTVAYFVADTAFLFDKATKTMSSFPYSPPAIESFLEVATRTRGYIICDVMWGKQQTLSVKLPPAGWGMLVVLPPGEARFREWEDEMGARRIVMDCPDESDVTAMCTWLVRECPAEEKAEYWEDFQKGMALLGPIQRNVLRGYWHELASRLQGAMERLSTWAVNCYVGLDKTNLWRCRVPTEDFSKMVRVVTGRGTECFQNAPASAAVRADVLVRVARAMRTRAGFMTVLMPHHVLLPSAVWVHAVGAFMYPGFVGRMRRKLRELRSPTGREPRPCLLQTNPRLRPTDAVALRPKVLHPGKVDANYRVLYVPGVENFPLMDAFFFVAAPRRTMVGLQTTTAKARRVATDTVRQFNEQLAEFFEGWKKFARGLSWEIIYVQRADSVTINAWQECKNAGDRASAEDKWHRTFWDNEVRQYHMAISHEDAIAVCSA
ncbi:retrotransposon hot spot (RHS) protein, partial [Trypanosoma conorhini]